MTAGSVVYSRMIFSGAAKVTPKKMVISRKVNRYMTVTAFFVESWSLAPQKRAVIMELPMPMPVQRIWKTPMNWLARLEADNAVSPSCPSMTVSIMLTPTEISPCMDTGSAIASTAL